MCYRRITQHACGHNYRGPIICTGIKNPQTGGCTQQYCEIPVPSKDVCYQCLVRASGANQPAWNAGKH